MTSIESKQKSAVLSTSELVPDLDLIFERLKIE
jgi:hypothetical protein